MTAQHVQKLGGGGRAAGAGQGGVVADVEGGCECGRAAQDRDGIDEPERSDRPGRDRADTLGLADRLEEHFAGTTPPTPDEVNRAFWGACHGGRHDAAECLLERGADVNWIPSWENLTPLDAAARENAETLVQWLHAQGAQSATDLTP